MILSGGFGRGNFATPVVQACILPHVAMLLRGSGGAHGPKSCLIGTRHVGRDR